MQLPACCCDRRSCARREAAWGRRPTLATFLVAVGLPLAGVVLFSDGAENGDSLSEERLAEIASYGVPIHTVGVGPEQVRDDLELEQVEVAASAPLLQPSSTELGNVIEERAVHNLP